MCATVYGQCLEYLAYIKFIYSEKATKFCKIFPLLLTVCTVVKSKGKISQNFVDFSEYMNFNVTLREFYSNNALAFQGSETVNSTTNLLV